jgi:hypothetical protein
VKLVHRVDLVRRARAFGLSDRVRAVDGRPLTVRFSSPPHWALQYSRAGCARQRTESMLDLREDGANGQLLTRFTHPEVGDLFESLGSDCRHSAAFAGSREDEREERRNL